MSERDLSWPGPGVLGDQRARVVETHASVLWFLGDRVYKVRKPVRFGFLDFRSRRARAEDCAREVALNRRLAPDVYLGVADIVVDGEPIDHAVVMRRLPDDRRLAAMAAAGRPLDACIDEVATTMAEFHRSAERSPDISAHATPAALWEGWQANFAEASPYVGTILDPSWDAEIRRLADRWLAGRGGLLEARIAQGRVADGHGDLLADDVFCCEDGVRILDCLEFSESLRAGDVVADMAFLAMDLERLDRGPVADRLVARYLELTADPAPAALVDYYCGARAYVRAEVACLRAAQGSTGAHEEARALHRLALRFLQRAQVTLVLVGGLPGTGKSTLATGLAAARGWAVVSSDEVRRETVAPEGSAAGFRVGRYSPGATAAVYDEMLARAEVLLGSARSVVLDASWVDAAGRAVARAAAARTSCELVELRCDVPGQVARARIIERLGGEGAASEATPEVHDAMAEAMDPWPSATVVDTSRAPADVLEAVLALLGSSEPERAPSQGPPTAPDGPTPAGCGEHLRPRGR